MYLCNAGISNLLRSTFCNKTIYRNTKKLWNAYPTSPKTLITMFTGGVIVELFECESEDKALHIALCDNRADLYPLCFDLWGFKVSSHAANTQSKNMYLSLNIRELLTRNQAYSYQRDSIVYAQLRHHRLLRSL